MPLSVIFEWVDVISFRVGAAKGGITNGINDEEVTRTGGHIFKLLRL
jgi:hypothetical protein